MSGMPEDLVMNEPTVEELKALLRETYTRIEQRRLGLTRLVEYDPAGSTYEFTEFDWSKRCREILGFTFQPTGL